MTKNNCDVSAVEFAKALRLTNNVVEHLSFTVPRIKSELFQDDLFPPTRVVWSSTMTANEWFSGKDKISKFISLQPEGMECCEFFWNFFFKGFDLIIYFILVSSQNTVSSTPVSKKNDVTQQHIINSQNRLGYTDVGGFTKSKQEEVCVEGTCNI